MKRVVVGVQFNMLAFVAAFCLALSLICCFGIADESATRPAATLDRYNSRESRLTTTMCCVSFGQIPKRFETTRDNLKRIKEQFSRPKSFNRIPFRLFLSSTILLQRPELPRFDGASGSHRFATQDSVHPRTGVCGRGRGCGRGRRGL